MSCPLLSCPVSYPVLAGLFHRSYVLSSVCFDCFDYFPAPVRSCPILSYVFLCIFSLLSTYQATSYPDPPRPAKPAEYDGQCPVFRRARGLRISSNTNKLSNTTVDGIDFGGDGRYPGSPSPKEKRENRKQKRKKGTSRRPRWIRFW